MAISVPVGSIIRPWTNFVNAIVADIFETPQSVEIAILIANIAKERYKMDIRYKGIESISLEFETEEKLILFLLENS